MFDTEIPLYGIMITISILLGLIVIYRNSKNINIKREELLIFLIYILLGTVVGAKYYTYLTNLDKYANDFDFSLIGFSSYGAVIGVIIMLIVFSKQFKIMLSDLLYVTLSAIPLMYGIGKIGCFLSGCCYGIYYSGPLSVVYKYSLSAPHNVELFPIQIVETIVFILIFIFISYLIKKEEDKLFIISISFLMCGLAKFSLDYLRMSHVGQIISINQIVSLLFIVIGIDLLFYKKKNTN